MSSEQEMEAKRMAEENIVKQCSTPSVAVDVPTFLTALVPNLKPPVANRVWFQGEQFFAMIVGGPNSRDDFHFQPGQELFYMIKGDMNLDVMEDGIGRRRIPIGHEQMFLLPKDLHHSPQRNADTIGLVFERIRKPADTDYLKWYNPGTEEVLYQEDFHCADINNALKPIISRFFASPQAEILTSAPKKIPDVSSHASGVIHLPTLVDAEVASASTTNTLQKKCLLSGEFVVDIYCGGGSVVLDIGATDSFMWQRNGASTVTVSNANSVIELGSNTASFVPMTSGASMTVQQVEAEACLMVVTCTVPYP